MFKTIRKTEAVGRLPVYRSGVPCVVIGEAWPAWLPVVPALGAKVSAVICKENSHWESELSDEAPRLGVGTKEAARFMEESPKDTLMFVSGSAKFVLSLEPSIKNKSHIVVALDWGNRVSAGLQRAFPNLVWTRVVHEEVGGVTTSRNWIGSTPGITLGSIEKVPYCRTVGEILKATLKGRFGKDRDPPKPPPALENGERKKVLMESQGLVSPHGLWPANGRGLKVVAPSVFSKSGWVYRELTATELGAAWDLPVETLTSMANHQVISSEELEVLSNISRSTPCKSLWSFGQSMLLFGLSSDLEEDDDTREGQAKTVLKVERTTDSTKSTRSNNIDFQGFGMRLDMSAGKCRASITELESREGKEVRETKATKEDDAEVPIHLWNERVLPDWVERNDQEEVGRKLETIRAKLLLRRWKQNLRRSLVTHLNDKFGVGWSNESPRSTDLVYELEAGADALRRAMNTTWWSWDSGSALFFWRWPKDFQLEARDGTPIRLSGALPCNRTPQRMERDPAMRKKMEAKLETVRSRGYISSGRVASLTGFFAVPKGESDIRMVYDATQSGLNDSVWAPSFGLPTVDSTLRSIDFSTCLGDLDLGEMFLNFKLHPSVQPYAGVDLSAYISKAGDQDKRGLSTMCWERWSRCLMGFKPSPFNATRAFAWAEEIIRGDPMDETNPLHWNRVRLNLPGEETYDPTLPWLSKVVGEPGCESIAGDFASYIDDIRTSGIGEDECWSVSRRVASYCGYLGIQDAPRKRRSPSKTPGAWAGSNVIIQPEGIVVTVSKEKWKKTKGIIAKWTMQVAETGEVNYQEFESDLGFLIYVTRTFPCMQPYLKGFHLTLHGWRPNRDEEGWKLASNKMGRERNDWPGETELDNGSAPETSHPARVKAVPRLKDDLLALKTLTEGEIPPLRMVRPTTVRSVRYGFGDASGVGFGSTFSAPGSILYRHGIWGDDDSGRSSNWRELTNLVETLELEAMEGRLCGCEIFVFTDNSTAEAAFFKGTSSNILLFNLVLRLRKLEVAQQCLLHLVHVAGTRMIGQGSDGLSRGNLTEGVMLGKTMTSYVPLSATALERSAGLEMWFRSWAGSDLEVLSPKDWFGRGQGIGGYLTSKENVRLPFFKAGTFLWTPAPAVASVAMEELRRSRHKRENSVHLFACPRLMTNRWRKLVLKEADFVFEVPVGTAGVWEKNMHEPLLIAVCLPFLEHSPWKIGGTPRILELGGYPACRQSWCAECYTPLVGDKFHVEEPRDEGGFVWHKRGDELRYVVARSGDHLQCPFQCDLCIFRTLKGQDPGRQLADRALQRCIRRINLDALWARDPKTVASTRNATTRGIALSMTVGIAPPYPNLGTFPLQDTQGFGVAVQMVLASLNKGTYADYCQFDSIRGYRTAHANVYRASATGSGRTMVMMDQDSSCKRVTSSPTESDWFGRFTRGCKLRMGQISKSDLAMSADTVVLYMEKIEARALQAGDPKMRRLWVSVGAYSLLCYVGSLRGNEGFLLDLYGLRLYLGEGKTQNEKAHVVAPLLGRFKNELGERYHLILLAATTTSGLNPREWLEWLVMVRQEEGRTRGPAFCDEAGLVAYSRNYEDLFIEVLAEIQEERPDLISPTVDVNDYGLSRTWRRTSTSVALARGVDAQDIDFMNRWRTVENARGRRPVFQAMRDHYGDVRITSLDMSLRYTSAL